MNQEIIEYITDVTPKGVADPEQLKLVDALGKLKLPKSVSKAIDSCDSNHDGRFTA